MAIHEWRDNAELIVGVHLLGYLRNDDHVLDPTYGRGNWWKRWRPKSLVAHDLITDGVDFRALPESDATFDVVAFDPPYKLNGTATPAVDGRYGVHEYDSIEGRHELIRLGIDECQRVLKSGGVLLVKCQDQVCGGKIRWQTRIFADYAEQKHPLELVDSMMMIGSRPQPGTRRQQHARRNYSTLLIMRKAKR